MVAIWMARISRAHSLDFEGAQLGSSEGGKIAEAEVEGSNADSMGLEGAQLESLRVVKLPRRSKVAMGRSGAREHTA
jgi:hypothetical protein